MQKPTHVLFVCLGNICRSPLAESVFRHQVMERGVSHLFELDSAGTSGYHAGASPDARSVETARARGVEVCGVSRQITAEDLHTFDYIVLMDRENLKGVEEVRAASGGSARIHLLREWDVEAPGSDVPDPYYGGARGFEDVQDMVERSCAALLEDLLTSGRR